MNPAAGWLRRGEREVELSSRPFEVLHYLIEHRDRVVSKQELAQALWKDTFVSDDALVQAITSVRRALGDDAERPRYVRTKARVGYQFIGEVEAVPTASVVPDTLAPIRPKMARTLFLVIQASYLTLYGLTLYHVEGASEVVARALDWGLGAGYAAMAVVVFLAMAGTAVRLYVIAAVAFDHPETGRKFFQLFPALLVLDLIWALAPLLVAEKTGYWLALAVVPMLVYGPFSQHSLVRSAYSPTELPPAGKLIGLFRKSIK